MIFLGAGNQIFFPKFGIFSGRRLGGLKLQEPPSAHVRMEVAQESDSSVTLTQDEFAQNLKPLPTCTQFRAARPKTLSIGDIKLRQCKLDELRMEAAASRPDICARRARIAARANSLQGSDAYRINDMVETLRAWPEGASSQYFFSSQIDKREKRRRTWGNKGKRRADSRRHHDSCWLVGCDLW